MKEEDYVKDEDVVTEQGEANHPSPTIPSTHFLSKQTKIIIPISPIHRPFPNNEPERAEFLPPLSLYSPFPSIFPLLLLLPAPRAVK